MEQHPVPQDIKSFQFKLIGDMTLRQFAFLGGGLVVAYLAFVLPLHPLLKWPTIFLSSLFGIGCAFFPINERPLDQWVIAFLKAIFGPTQRVFLKSNQLPVFLQPTLKPKKAPPPVPEITEDREKLKQYLASLPKKTEEALADEEKKFLSTIQTILAPGEETAAQKTIEEKAPRPSLAAGEILITKPVLKVTDLVTAKPKHIPTLGGARVRKLGKPQPGTTPSEIPITPATPPPPPREIFTKTEEVTKMAKEEVTKAKRIEEYQREVEKLKAEKERLLKEAEQRREETRKAREAIAKITKKQPEEIPSEEEPTPLPTPPEESPIPTAGPIKKLVLPKITDQANIINGVIADREGNLLEGVIIVVKDQDGTPVRALKTNPLGQFATATALTNGVYSIEAEKEGYQFDIIYQEAKGGVIPPLEIRAK